MTIKVWDSSKWAIASQIKVWDGSAWKERTNANVHVWTGSAWQKVHPPVELNQGTGYGVFAQDPNESAPPSLGNALAELILYSNGTLQIQTSTSVSGTILELSQPWLLNGLNSEYDVFVRNFSGDALTGSSAPVDGSRVRLDTTRAFGLYRDTDGTSIADFNLILCANNSSGTDSNVEIQNTTVSLTASVGLIE